MNPLNFVYWHSGPQKVALGDFAEMDVPAGYRFTDVHGARNILKTFNNPIPDNLIGILAPVTGSWLAILEYTPDGYVKNPDFKQVNTEAVLKQVLDEIAEEQGQSSIKSLSWKSPPAYDARKHALQWSFQIVTPSAKILDQAAAMFGRHGIFQITMAHYAPPTGASPLKQLISDVHFKDGERYADYKNGDEVAQIGLADLVSGEKKLQATGLFSGGIETDVSWIYGGLGLCLITGGGGVAVVHRRNKTRRRHAAPAPASAISGNQPLAEPQLNFASNVGNGAKPLHASYRDQAKMMFDHQKYYRDFMQEHRRRSFVQPHMAPGKPIFINHAKINRGKTTKRKPEII